MIQPDWQTGDGSIRLYLGDCLTILPTLEAGVAQAVITDPPYGIDYQSAWRIDRSTWKPKIANDETPFIWFLYPAIRVAAESSCLLSFCRWDVQEAFKQAIGWAGWECKSQVIWDREAHGMGDLNGCPAPQHDVIWFATKDGFKFHGDRPKSVVRSCRLGGEQLEHPNQKPVDLMEQLVESYCAPGETVLDCFLGSGTTAVACARTGRKCIGIESDPAHFETACNRTQEEIERHPLFEEPTKIQRTLIQ